MRTEQEAPLTHGALILVKRAAFLTRIGNILPQLRSEKGQQNARALVFVVRANTRRGHHSITSSGKGKQHWQNFQIDLARTRWSHDQTLLKSAKAFPYPDFS
jgi:hypothetical protein